MVLTGLGQLHLVPVVPVSRWAVRSAEDHLEVAVEAIQGLPAAISLEAAAILAVAVAIHPAEADPALVPLKVPTSVGFLLPVGPLLSQAL